MEFLNARLTKRKPSMMSAREYVDYFDRQWSAGEREFYQSQHELNRHKHSLLRQAHGFIQDKIINVRKDKDGFYLAKLLDKAFLYMQGMERFRSDLQRCKAERALSSMYDQKIQQLTKEYELKIHSMFKQNLVMKVEVSVLQEERDRQSDYVDEIQDKENMELVNLRKQLQECEKLIEKLHTEASISQKHIEEAEELLNQVRVEKSDLEGEYTQLQGLFRTSQHDLCVANRMLDTMQTAKRNLSHHAGNQYNIEDTAEFQEMRYIKEKLRAVRIIERAWYAFKRERDRSSNELTNLDNVLLLFQNTTTISLRDCVVIPQSFCHLMDILRVTHMTHERLMVEQTSKSVTSLSQVTAITRVLDSISELCTSFCQQATEINMANFIYSAYLIRHGDRTSTEHGLMDFFMGVEKNKSHPRVRVFRFFLQEAGNDMLQRSTFTLSLLQETEPQRPMITRLDENDHNVKQLIQMTRIRSLTLQAQPLHVRGLNFYVRFFVSAQSLGIHRMGHVCWIVVEELVQLVRYVFRHTLADHVDECVREIEKLGQSKVILSSDRLYVPLDRCVLIVLDLWYKEDLIMSERLKQLFMSRSRNILEPSQSNSMSLYKQNDPLSYSRFCETIESIGCVWEESKFLDVYKLAVQLNISKPVHILNFVKAARMHGVMPVLVTFPLQDMDHHRHENEIDFIMTTVPNEIKDTDSETEQSKYITLLQKRILILGNKLQTHDIEMQHRLDQLINDKHLMEKKAKDDHERVLAKIRQVHLDELQRMERSRGEISHVTDSDAIIEILQEQLNKSQYEQKNARLDAERAEMQREDLTAKTIRMLGHTQKSMSSQSLRPHPPVNKSVPKVRHYSDKGKILSSSLLFNIDSPIVLPRVNFN